MHANSNIFRIVLAGLCAVAVAGVATVSAPNTELGEVVQMAGDNVGPGLEGSTPELQDAVIETGLAASADDPIVGNLTTEPGGALGQDADTAPATVSTQTADPVEGTPQAEAASTTNNPSDAPDSPATEIVEVPESPEAPESSDQDDPVAAPIKPGDSATSSSSSAAGEETPEDSRSANDSSSTDEQPAEVDSRATQPETGTECSSDHCPTGIGLEPTEINDNEATFTFFPIAGAEPTFNLQRAFPATDGNTSLPSLEVFESSLRVVGMTSGTEYILTANRFFGFDSGSTTEVIYFQTLSRAVDRYCDQVEVKFEDDLITQRETELYSSTTSVELDPDCGAYDVWLHSADYNHREGFQTYQLGEQWQLEGMNLSGEILYRSPSTPDLEEAVTAAYHLVDETDETGISQVRAFHTGEGNINSVRAGATFMPVIANPRTPSLCGTIDVLFINPTLVNGIDDADRTTVGMPNSAPAREYQIWLYSKDEGHGTGESGGPAEQWFVEGLDAEGNVVYTSPVAPDLPDDQVVGQFFGGTVTLDGISTIRGRHLGRLGDNSVEASIMLVPVSVGLPDEPYPAWCRHLNLQRP